ncbi:MAG: hypothetical protein KDD14_18600 [Saprospiraceae bacterium]|nr:hypothetical protein [candidate division KSB1 bacterium]MCB0534219.1 hypothetical protein [Saprospiraceae bacterium]
MKKTFTLCAVLLLALSVSAQKRENLYIRLGLNVGASKLYHNTHFQATNLVEVYEFVQLSHDPPESYTWKDFEKDYGLHSSYSQPRYGLNLYLAHKLFPVFLNMEWMSSSSSYQKSMFAMTLGLGKDIHPIDMDFFFSGHVGLKRVFKDSGFGAETITFSTSKEARERLATFYNPSKPLGAQSGNLLALRVGCGRVLGAAERAAVGAELFYELDLTNETVRQSRMTNFGFNIYFRFDLANTSF